MSIIVIKCHYVELSGCNGIEWTMLLLRGESMALKNVKNKNSIIFFKERSFFHLVIILTDFFFRGPTENVQIKNDNNCYHGYLAIKTSHLNTTNAWFKI